MIQNIKCCTCALRRECRAWEDQEDEPAYNSLKGQTNTEMEQVCLSRSWALNSEILMLEVGIRQMCLFSLTEKIQDITTFVLLTYKKITCSMYLTENKE